MSEFDYEMPEEYKELLLYMVDTARKNHVLAIAWSTPGMIDDPRTTNTPNDIKISTGTDERIFKNLLGNPLRSFEVLGLVAIYSIDGIVGGLCLTPKAYKWTEYQRKNKLGKWIAKRSREQITFILALIAFPLATLATILSILTYIQTIATK